MPITIEAQRAVSDWGHPFNIQDIFKSKDALLLLCWHFCSHIALLQEIMMASEDLFHRE